MLCPTYIALEGFCSLHCCEGKLIFGRIETFSRRRYSSNEGENYLRVVIQPTGKMMSCKKDTALKVKLPTFFACDALNEKK